MKKCIFNIPIILVILIVGTSTAFCNDVVRYEFEGVFTTGELEGYPFSGWFDYDTTEFGYYQQTSMQVFVPIFHWEDETGNIIVEDYDPPLGGPFYTNIYQDSFESSYDVWGYQVGGSTSYTGWTLYIYWTGTISDPSDLIPIGQITDTLFSFQHYDYFAWFDSSTLTYHYEDVTFEGYLTELRIAPEPVDVDIKPGSYKNSINLNGHGVIRVAILGGADFDVSEIKRDSLLLNGSAVRIRGRKEKIMCNYGDVSGDFTSPEGSPDGYVDLVCHFEYDRAMWAIGQSVATLTGELLDGTPIEGTDYIWVVPQSKSFIRNLLKRKRNAK